MPRAPFRTPLRTSCGLLSAALLLAGCTGDTAGGARDAEPPPPDGRLFTRLPASYTGVRFANRVVDTRELNVFTYRHFYNGGGVAIGDLNGDSLPELFLTASQGGSRLYLNEGDFRFRDVTREAGIGREDDWATGVTFGDANGDGRLDIYVSHAGKLPAEQRRNALYLNDGADERGIPRFTDRARELGVADEGHGTSAAFLDYDADGDLDLFVVNNSPQPVSSFGMRNLRAQRDSLPGNRLYRNDGARFTDVSEAAGIHGSEISFALGLVVADIDRDGRPDVYVANDFFERDYLYRNNGDGTFTDELDRQMPVMSYFSMGMDVADLDNDGWADIYTTDMLPEDETRLRLTSTFEGWDVYQRKVKNGYHHQLMRNMLQRNNGDGTFTDVAYLGGVARTDWSWGALIADLDLDGAKDIFVTNGLAKDITSQDYVAFLADQNTMREVTQGGKVDFERLTEALGSTALPNYAFRNTGNLAFTNESRAWGLDEPSFSSGAAYGDLDGDGALDLVVTNVDQEVFVYRNDVRTVHPERRSVQVRLEGEGANRFGVGARVTLYLGDSTLVQEQSPTRGFQSSVDYLLTFGVGARAAVDSLQVRWPDGRTSVVAGVPSGRRVVVRQAEAAPAGRAPAPVVRAAWAPGAPGATGAAPLLVDATDAAGIAFEHRENAYVDFDRERLLPKMLSTEGPALAVGDVNRDGLDDLYLGGAKEQAGALLVQQADGRFAPTNAALFEQDRTSEDVGAVFFDANGDGAPDLYVVSGGSEFSEIAPALQDRLYLNDGRGTFRKAPADHLPFAQASGSRVAAADYDGDGDVDLFVGGRVVPWRYGVDPRSALLRNDGRGRFTDATVTLAPELATAGMVTDAIWQDVDGDRRPDLVVVGDWMPVRIFRNAGGGRLAPMETAGLERSHGWWNRVVAGDFTGDGRVDFVVGNLGLNSRLRASAEAPLSMHVSDFDGNGFVEQVLTTEWNGKRWPFALRDELIRAIPPLKARALNYDDYATKSVDELFMREELAEAVRRDAYTLATTLVRNEGNGRFTLVPLPAEAQLAPVFGLLARDVDGDGHTDLVLGGNFDGVKPDVGRLGSSQGLVLRGDGAGGFAPLRAAASGVRIAGQVRDLAVVRSRGGDRIVVARNDDRPLVYRLTTRSTLQR